VVLPEEPAAASRGHRVSRGLFIFLAVVAAIALMGFFGLPHLKRMLVGQSFQARLNVTMAVEDFEVKVSPKSPQTVSRMVISLEVHFPMGGAPENVSELQVVDDTGKPIQVEWNKPEREDLPDQGVTRWLIKESFFPIDFRSGILRNKYNKDLGRIIVPQVPYNAP
jgi:hypothetical protein